MVPPKRPHLHDPPTPAGLPPHELGGSVRDTLSSRGTVPRRRHTLADARSSLRDMGLRKKEVEAVLDAARPASAEFGFEPVRSPMSASARTGRPLRHSCSATLLGTPTTSEVMPHWSTTEHRRLRQKLLDTGLEQDEVEAALEGVAKDPLGWSRKDRRPPAADPEALIGAMELLDLVEKTRGTKAMFVSEQTQVLASPRNASFATLLERCEALLEEKDEADYVQKKQLAAQVRAYLSVSNRGDSPLPTDSDTDCDERSPTRQQQPSPSEVFSGVKPSAPSKPKGDFQRVRGGFASAHELFEQLLSGERQLPRKYVRSLLQIFPEAWVDMYGSKMTLLQGFNVPVDGKVVVVGDTHGQLTDVLTIFMQHGEPSAKNRYIFNGDIADRGPNAAEIFCLIFHYFIEDPTSIVINRGNHEDDEMNRLPQNEGGGFQEEVMNKYGNYAYSKFVQCFKLFPLAIVMNDELLIVHGGLARNSRTTLSLDFISSIDASNVCCPSSCTTSLKELVHADLLWSDPVETLGIQTSQRGLGVLWGPDLTRSFLKRTGLQWIIRSHELPRDRRGWMEHHLGLVFTVFSASNYQGVSQNKGAVAVLELPPNSDWANKTCSRMSLLQVRFEEFYAPGEAQLQEIAALPDSETRRRALVEAGAARARHDNVVVGERRERFVLNRMAGRVVERRPELLEAFFEVDQSRHGMVSIDTWSEVVASICGEHFPWQIACQTWNLAEKQKGSEKCFVDYGRFLSRFEVGISTEQWMGWKAALMRDVYEAIMERDDKLQETKKNFDRDQNGKVSLSEFLQVVQEVCTVNNQEGPTRIQLLALTHGLFPPGSRGQEACEGPNVEPEVDVDVFFGRFAVVYHQSASMVGSDPLAEWRPLLNQIGRLLMSSGIQRRASLMLVSRSPSTTCSPRRSPRVTDGCDERAARRLQDIFTNFDDSGDGLLQTNEFVNHLLAVPGIEKCKYNGEAVGREALAQLGEALDMMSGTKTGRVNFVGFLEAFAVCFQQKNVKARDQFDAEKAERTVVEHILSVFYRHRHCLWCSCMAKDPSFTGRVSEEDFVSIMRTTDMALATSERRLSDTQILALAHHLSEDDGKVPYVTLVKALVVRDTEQARKRSKTDPSTDTRQRSASLPGIG
eukprot:TRINITY_DN17479_c0_g1_i1.p1 TRINITY_DN17479_c0_g1~~TRINITY_DN17479_c0_g1_i1.p1  ORF type:complete len:1132 (-),score=206.66 TRINITY_DN17479_c0_g1_i1:50-3445(-)